ncbi:MAG TPA: C-terminal binding protein [Pseudolysinimonas sp.]|nr:C-terminal binding protein [Pseudolysinimonas sp.]
MTRARPRVVYTDVSDLDPRAGIELLESTGFDVVVLQDASDDDIRRAAADAVAIVCGYHSIGAGILDAAPSVGVVATLSVGFDMVDIDAADRLGIRVCNVPAHATEEVATHALALLLALERNIVPTAATVAAGVWDAVGYGAPRRLSSLTLGIAGFGRIGQAFHERASGLFDRTLLYDPLASRRPVEGADWVGLDDLLAQSDVVSLHVPATPETYRMLSPERLASVKVGVSIINVSRGSLIDSAALLRGLEDGRIRSAGLDVTDPEPPAVDDPLLRHPRVIATPHVAFASRATLREYALAPARAILAWWTGDESEQMVNRPGHPRRPGGVE